jgi:hypothetical protein
MKKGDHLVSSRLGYSHHGLYVGEGRVVHYAGFHDGLNKGTIEETSLEEFAQSEEVKVLSSKLRVYDRQESVSRAYESIGEGSYNIVFNNCEHFVNWCIYGVKFSKQVNNVVVRTLGVAYHANGCIKTGPVILRAIQGASSVSSVVSTSTVASVVAGATAGASTAAGSGTVIAGIAASGAAATAAAPVFGAIIVLYAAKKTFDRFFG